MLWQKAIGAAVRGATMRSPITEPGRCSALLDGLPTAIPDPVKVVQGLIIHSAAVECGGVALDEATPEQVRFVADMLQHIVDRSSAPLTTEREPSHRLQSTGRASAGALQGLNNREWSGMPSQEFLDHSYIEYEHIEEAFQAELDTSLNPRGLDYLLDMVGRLALAPGSTAVDVGCGEGRYCVELARRFALLVHGIDPVPAHIEICNQKRSETAMADPETAQRLRFDLGEVESLPEDDATQDLVWFRDALVHVAAVDRAFGECYRVLRQGGYLLLYHQLATDRLEPREASWLWRTMGVIPRNTDPGYIESAYPAVGFELVERVELRSEWMEHNEETKGAVSRQVLHAARLLRSPDRYLAQFGQRAYDIMLGDCLWHIYQMIGKLSPRIYLLRKPVQSA